jgi:hypothetical protein
LEARGVEPLFPACYVQQRPLMLYQKFPAKPEWPVPFQRRIRFHAQAWTYADVISFVIRWQAFGNIWNRVIGPLVSLIRTAGSAGSQRRRQTIRRRSRSLKKFERAARKRISDGSATKLSFLQWSAEGKRTPALILGFPPRRRRGEHRGKGPFLAQTRAGCPLLAAVNFRQAPRMLTVLMSRCGFCPIRSM